MSNGISSYYPSGQRILEKKGYDEYNYENFIRVFRNRISHDDREIIVSNDSNRINFLRICNETKRGIYHTLLLISETILGSFLIFLTFSLPYYFLVEKEYSIIDKNGLGIFIIFAIIVLICSSISTTVIYNAKSNVNITLEANRLKE